MLRSRNGGLPLLIVLTLAAPICAPVASLAQSSAGNVVGIYGLESIRIDDWTQMLAAGRSTGMTAQELRVELAQILQTAANEQEFFKVISEKVQSARLQTSDDYQALGLMLMEFREGLRQRAEVSQRVRQDSLFLLQMMAEESFFVASRKFSEFPKEMIVKTDVRNTGGSVMLRQFSVQTGDVVLSKATGAGSSAFIALSMDHPHIFSHSTPIDVSDKGELLSPEADIADGVKLRNMQNDYVGDVKTRMFIYRYKDSDSRFQSKLEGGMQNLVSEMYQRTGGDPFNKAAYKYDFSMLPGDATGRGLFCSAVAYEVYSRAGAQGLANPYSKSVWSPINKGREILLKVLDIDSDRVPAPGDLELNRSFALVGARVDVTKLPQDRIEMAIVDAFLSTLESNRKAMTKFAAALDKIGNKPLDKNALKAMAASGILPKELADKAALIDQIPDSINAKQMAFFAFLNEYLVPKLRVAMFAQTAAMEQQGHILGPVGLRELAMKNGQAIQTEVGSFIDKISALP